MGLVRALTSQSPKMSDNIPALHLHRGPPKQGDPGLRYSLSSHPRSRNVPPCFHKYSPAAIKQACHDGATLVFAVRGVNGCANNRRKPVSVAVAPALTPSRHTACSPQRTHRCSFDFERRRQNIRCISLLRDRHQAG